MKPVIAIFIFCGVLITQHTLAQTTDTLPSNSADTPATINTAPIENAVRDFIQDSSKVSVGDSVVAELKKPLRDKGLSVRTVAVPTALITYGVLTFVSKDLQRLNRYAREEIWQERNNGFPKPTHVDNFTIWAPVVTVYALNLAGVKGKNNLLDRSLIYGLSNLIGNGLVFTTKSLTHVVRPDSSNYYSFPSGHTAKVFLAAEFLRQEYKHRSPWYGVTGYTVAIGTGILRMYNNKHWLNDVVAGAGVGILSTRLAYWLYPKLKNSFIRTHKHKNNGNTLILPTYQDGAFGVGLVRNF
jgi:membrane-associated phospholipid phosphatase